MSEFKQQLEAMRDRMADEHTNSTYFHLEYSCTGKTARECNNSYREGFNAAIPIILKAVEQRDFESRTKLEAMYGLQLKQETIKEMKQMWDEELKQCVDSETIKEIK